MNIGMGDGVDCDEQVSFENQDLGYFDLESHQGEGFGESVWRQSVKQVIGSYPLVLVGRAGFEPTTNGLKVRCSTD